MKSDSERVRLRKLRVSDANDIYENIRDKEVVRWLLSVPHPYSFNDAVRFIRRSQYRVKKNTAHAFGIVLKETNRVIGVVEIFNIDWDNRSADIGYWLGKKYWNRGLMTEAVKLALRFAFKELKLHRLSTTTFEENLASRRVLEKAGFRLEGKKRQSRLKFGEWQNELLYGILESEYQTRSDS
jgi:RimJ/RimL family protein N-acetyltransferase